MHSEIKALLSSPRHSFSLVEYILIHKSEKQHVPVNAAIQDTTEDTEMPKGSPNITLELGRVFQGGGEGETYSDYCFSIKTFPSPKCSFVWLPCHQQEQHMTMIHDTLEQKIKIEILFINFRSH